MSIKPSDFSRSLLWHFPLPLLRSAYAVFIKCGHILDKSGRVSCCCRGEWEWKEVAKAGIKSLERQRTHEEASKALCMSEIALLSLKEGWVQWVMLLLQHHDHYYPVAMDASLCFVFQCCPCPSQLPAFSLSPEQPSLHSLGRVEKASLVWEMFQCTVVIFPAETLSSGSRTS